MPKDPQALRGFKTTRGKYLTKALFYEQNLFEGKAGALYTLKTKAHKGYPSLKELYFEINDPTEYEVANTLFDGWEHWNILCGVWWFKPYIESWRRELAVRWASEGLNRVISEVRDSKSKGSLSAAKYLLANGWLAETSKMTRGKAGRPRKDEVLGDLDGDSLEDIQKDADRVLDPGERVLN